MDANSFTPKIWKSQIGTDLNRFQLKGLPDNPIVNLNWSFGQKYSDGDAFSQENLNDLEQRIETAVNSSGSTLYVLELPTDKTEDWLEKEQIDALTSSPLGYIKRGDYIYFYNNMSGVQYYNYRSVEQYNSFTTLRIYTVEIDIYNWYWRYYLTEINTRLYSHVLNVFQGNTRFNFRLFSKSSTIIWDISSIITALTNIGITDTNKCLPASGFHNGKPITGVSSIPGYLLFRTLDGTWTAMSETANVEDMYKDMRHM